MADQELPRTRAKALALRIKHYFTGSACLLGHVATRSTANWTCDACLAEKNASAERRKYLVDYRAKNAEHRRKYNQRYAELHPSHQKDYYQRNRAERLAAGRAWREAHPEETKAYLAAYRIANRDRVNGQVKEWLKRNAVQQLAWHAKRNADKIRATPAWADLDMIRAFYDRASEITAATGVEHQVDHIVPLRGKTVCGLHVHCNLQVITATENRRKKNRLIAPKD